MKLIKDFTGFITESEAAAPKGWDAVYSALSGFESPKILRWKDEDGQNITLNWGSAKESGHELGLAVRNLDTRVSVVGAKAEEAKQMLAAAGLKPNQYGDPDWAGLEPAKAVAAIKSVITKYGL